MTISTGYIPCGGVITSRSPMIKANNLMSGHEYAHWLGLADWIIDCKLPFGNDWLYPVGRRNGSKGIWQTAGTRSSCMSSIPIISWWREPNLDLSWLCFPFLIFGGTVGGCCTLEQFTFRTAAQRSVNILLILVPLLKHGVCIPFLYTQQKSTTPAPLIIGYQPCLMKGY